MGELDIGGGELVMGELSFKMWGVDIGDRELVMRELLFKMGAAEQQVPQMSEVTCWKDLT